MVNKLQDPAKKEWISKFFKSVLLTGTTLLFLLQPGFSKNNDKVKAAIKETLEQYDVKEYQIEETNNDESKTYIFEQAQNNLDWGNNALSYATNNVKKYYPDMEKHLNDMINRFGNDTERKDVVNKIFNETLMEIKDPKQRIWAIIYSLEGYIIVMWWSDFSDKYDSDITTETYAYMEKVEKKYNTRLKARLINLEKIKEEIKKNTEILEKNTQKLAKNQQELAKNTQELINILNKITAEEVKNNERIKDLVIKTKALCFEHGIEINPHIDELFTLVP